MNRSVLPAVLEDIYSSGKVCDARGDERDAFPAATRREDAEVLTALVRQHRPKRTLEIGMAYGLSTVAIAAALPDGAERHVVIDPFQSVGWGGIGLHTVERAGLSHKVEVAEEPSQTVLASYQKEGRTFDFVFHDGSHLFDYLMADLHFINRMLPEGGILVIDDLWMPAVRRAASFLITNLDYVVEPTGAKIPLADRLAKPMGRFAKDPRPFAPVSITTFAGKVMKLRKSRDRKRNWTDFNPF